MSTPPDTDSTSLFETRKLFAGGRIAARVRALADMWVVFALAREIARGDTRRTCLLSVQESQAIAALAVSGGEMISHAIALLDASDAGDAAEVRARLTALCNFTRTLLAKEQT